ncbi:MAG: efflux transporter outer membrane subunit [Deltaproteobacteria bacterium]|nr:efflux transporter outer membrane subunit [Deltaproteobacteria bacterium]
MIAACSLFKPETRKVPEGDLPEKFSIYHKEAGQAARWWEDFNSNELNRLIETALSENFSIKQAWARLRQARTLVVQSDSSLYPDLTGTADVLYGRRKTTNGSSDTTTVEEYALGLTSSYELDLWGRVHSKRQAVMLEAAASKDELHAAAVTLSAEIVIRWIEIISQRMQKQLLHKQLDSNIIFLDLIELRFRKGMVSALDVYQQKQVVENIKAELPLVEAREMLLMHELASLLGKPSGSSIPVRNADLPIPVGIPALGLPADLLKARPDVRAAGLRLESADWQVAEARANRLPAVRLSASARYSSNEMEVLFDNWLLNLAANLTAPVFDGGQRAAEVDRTRAFADEKLWAYRQTVLTAVKEVEDALISESKQKEHIEALERVIAAARRALDEAVERYRKGLNDYLPVLTQLLTVQSLERNLIKKRTSMLLFRVSLYRALSGTWTHDLKPDGLPETSKTEGKINNE